MDVLADAFSTPRIGGMIFATSDLRAPFALRFEKSTKTGFHVIARGTGWLVPSAAKAKPLRLVQGDVVMLPRGWTHTLADRPSRRGEPYPTALARQASARGEVAMRVVCGAYAVEGDAVHPLLALLPPIVHVRADGLANDDLVEVVRLLTKEAGSAQPGSTAIASRLVDVLFLQVVRAWLATQPEGATAGWLGALRDPAIGRALALIHARPSEPWTVESLGLAIGMSRAAFARRFASLVGASPLSYLSRWRMTLAARALRETDRSLAEIARDVGYESEFAFNRAFKRDRGIAPGRFRRERPMRA